MPGVKKQLPLIFQYKFVSYLLRQYYNNAHILNMRVKAQILQEL